MSVFSTRLYRVEGGGTKMAFSETFATDANTDMLHPRPRSLVPRNENRARETVLYEVRSRCCKQALTPSAACYINFPL